MDKIISNKNEKAKLIDYIKLIRVKQYIKNLFVLGALVFSSNFLNTDAIINSLLAFISFCLISSAVYVLNDIIDIDKDRQHPKKAKRPLASGIIKKRQAIILLALLVLVSMFIAININIGVLIIIVLYLINNIFYSFKLKNVILIDVFSISLGFILRLSAGAVAINVSLSNWIILCTLFLSLYLGLGKRKKEISLLKDNADNHRKILKEYNNSFIDQCMTVTMSSAIVCYSLYSATYSSKEYMIYTTIFVVYGIFRYNYIINTIDEGNPTDVIVKDLPLILNILLWGISCLLILLW